MLSVTYLLHSKLWLKDSDVEKKGDQVNEQQKNATPNSNGQIEAS